MKGEWGGPGWDSPDDLIDEAASVVDFGGIGNGANYNSWYILAYVWR
jgi:hypothetical protein